MLELNSETFLAEANKKNVLLCIFYNESVDNLQEIVLRVIINNHQCTWATMGYLDIEQAPDIGHMFGISTEEPTILIMREQIVLFCEPLSSIEEYDIFSIVDQIKNLDMKKIKYEIHTEKQSMVHLFGRRVCPTAKRMRGNDK